MQIRYAALFVIPTKFGSDDNRRSRLSLLHERIADTLVATADYCDEDSRSFAAMVTRSASERACIFRIT